MKAPKQFNTSKQGLDGHGKYKHLCVVCKKVFSDKRHLEDHYRSKHGGPKLQCQHCPKTFASLRSLEHHTNHHSGKYPLYCSQCDAGFEHRKDLLAHEDKHQGRGYVCLICKKVFFAERSFFKHQEKCVKPE